VPYHELHIAAADGLSHGRGAMLTFLLAFTQGLSFCLVSRSRNRDNLTYHLFSSLFSNAILFATFRHLVLSGMSFWLFLPYTVGMTLGSLLGMRCSLWIERRIA